MTDVRKSALSRLLTAGLHDADRRLSWFVPQPASHAPQVVKALESSVAVRAAERVLTTVRLAAGSSWAAVLTTQGATAWTRLAPPDQRFAGGVTLLAAVAVHVGLTVWHEVPAGWWWLILPGMAAALGLLLVLVSTHAGRGSSPS